MRCRAGSGSLPAPSRTLPYTASGPWLRGVPFAPVGPESVRPPEAVKWGAMGASDTGPEPGAEGGGEPSVFGNLPRSRPSVRSPRRARPDVAADREGTAQPDGGAGEHGTEAEIEALARAGLSLAGGAATLGLRAAGRAAAALRSAVERR